MKTGVFSLDKFKKYILPCGHNSAVFFNVYPFDLGMCTKCNLKFTTGQLKEVV